MRAPSALVSRSWRAQRSRIAAPLRAERGGIAARSSSDASTRPSSSGAVRVSAYSSSSQVRSLVGRRGGEHAGAAQQLEQRALGVGRRLVVHARHERSRARPQQPLRGRVLVDAVDLVVEPEPQPLEALVAPVGLGDRVDRVAAGGREGDRPGGRVERLGQRHRHRLDALQRPLVREVAARSARSARAWRRARAPGRCAAARAARAGAHVGGARAGRAEICPPPLRLAR